MPQTLAGAIRTALLTRTGFDFRAFSAARRQGSNADPDALKQVLRAGHADERIIAARFLGPWPCLFPQTKHRQPVPLFRQPLDLLKRKDSAEFVRLRVRREPLAGWDDADGLLPLVCESDTDSKAAFKLFSLPAVRAYLHGQLHFDTAELFEPGDVYGFENRTGIGIDAQTLSAADSMIYGVRFLTLKRRLASDKKHGGYAHAETGLYAEIHCDIARPDLKKLLTEPIPLGGEGRYVKVTAIDPVAWPIRSLQDSKTKWLLTAPAFLPRSAKSQRPLPAIAGLTAARSDAGVAVSGWDVARNGPRPTRFAIPAGAVYYFDGPGPTDGFLGGSDDEKAEGWGFALPGRWEDK